MLTVLFPTGNKCAQRKQSLRQTAPLGPDPVESSHSMSVYLQVKIYLQHMHTEKNLSRFNLEFKETCCLGGHWVYEAFCSVGSVAKAACSLTFALTPQVHSTVHFLLRKLLFASIQPYRLTMTYRESRDDRVRGAGHRSKVWAETQQAEHSLRTRDRIGNPCAGRQGLGASHFQQWAKASPRSNSMNYLAQQCPLARIGLPDTRKSI